jgi:hypothetical protein
VTYVADMPSVGVMAQTFEVQRVDYLSPEAGGRLGAVSAGWPLWSMSVDLNNMQFHHADIWRAWVQAQRGSQRRFWARDLDRLCPRFHASGRPFPPVAGGWSQAIDADGTATLTLTGCVGLVISLGDYVGFEWDVWKRSLVRAVSAAKADAGGSISFAIEPPVPSLTPGGATARLAQPTCLMRLDTSNTKLGKQALGYMATGGTIAGVQDLVA